MNRDRVNTLFIEDSERFAYSVSSMLESAPCFEYQIKVARSLREAVALLKAECFELVLLDLHLPDAKGMDGITGVRAVAPDVPLVVITGTGSREIEDAAYRENAADYIPKIGLPNGEILNRVRTAVVRHRAGCRFDRRYGKLNSALHKADAITHACEQNPALPPFPEKTA
jgi:DNA-binding response OmpR family regulator